MKSTISVAQAKRRINDKLSHFFGVTPADATNEQYYKAVAMILREMLSEKTASFAIRPKVRTLSRSTICVWSF